MFILVGCLLRVLRFHLQFLRKWLLGAVVSPIENETPSNKLGDGLLSITLPEEFEDTASFDINKDKSTISITVVGASGDLAKKKIFPALFALYYEDCLPEVCIYVFCFFFNFFFIWKFEWTIRVSSTIVCLYAIMDIFGCSTSPFLVMPGVR